MTQKTQIGSKQNRGTRRGVMAMLLGAPALALGSVSAKPKLATDEAEILAKMLYQPEDCAPHHLWTSWNVTFLVACRLAQKEIQDMDSPAFATLRDSIMRNRFGWDGTSRVTR